ncbi:MAG: GH92 family glycosyl hydrolase [Bacteroidia bacterium]
MRKTIFTLCIAHCIPIFSGFILFAQNNPAQYVNPFIGTGGHGHTFPGAAVPFGMVQMSPDTRIDGSWDGCSGYHQSDSVIYGFTHTHLSGTGCSDYGDILLMPMMGEPSFDNKIYSSHYSHEKEKASAGYYSVYLDDENIDVELTATARVGFHKYTFSNPGRASIILDLTHRDKTIDCELAIVDSTHISGFRKSDAWAKEQWVFFYIEFSKPFSTSKIQRELDYKNPEPNDELKQKGNIKAAFGFDVEASEFLLIKVGISGVDTVGARKNLESELNGWDFEGRKKEAKGRWNNELMKIEITSEDTDMLTVFYTALYHCMLQPNIYNDVDGRYRGRDMQIHKAEGYNYYTVFSLWDTFRAWHPLMTLIDTKRTLNYIKTFLAQFEQGGLLPVWELSSNETECMIGYHAVPVIADAAVKGIADFNLSEALVAMKKSAESKDRFGLDDYMDHGFLSMEDEHESVSKTLEYAYDDWCIAQMAKNLNGQTDYSKYIQRAQYWKNLFDKQTGFMRPKKNGNWLSPFDAREVNNCFTEANSWQYSFFVPQDISGLINTMGGKDRFDKKLDELFSTSNETTGREQVDITGLIGQYAHGNEPSHHMSYLYNYIGKPWKTQQHIHQIVSEFYRNSPDGLIGNEDCGQMSAWYILSAMGIYQVTPGSDVFVIGTPRFQETKIHLDFNKIFTIKAKNVSDKNFYIQSATLNGSPFSKSFITYSEIIPGGELIFTMGDKPNMGWGSKPGDFPVSEINEQKIILVPVIKSEGKTFKGKTKISLEGQQAGLKLYYMIFGSSEHSENILYSLPFEIDTTTTVRAYAENTKGEKSLAVKATFFKMPHPDWKIKIASPYSNQYTAGGDEGIIDGLHGETNWRKGEWQGYSIKDFEAVIDLGKVEDIKKLGAGFLQDSRAWILMPKKVEFEISLDGKNFTPVLTIPNTVGDTDEKVQIKDFTENITPQQAQFVKIKATNYGKLPEWHAGFEDKGDAWIFVDEIFVE